MSDGNAGSGGWDESGLEGGHGDQLDGLIEQALGSYTAREARAGLESRVLSRIAAAEAERGRWGWSWKPAWALAAAMAVLAVVGVPLGYRLGRQEAVVVHGPESRQTAVAEAGRAAPTGPLAAPTAGRAAGSAGRALTPHGRVAAAAPEGMEMAAKAGPAAVGRAMNAPLDDKQTDEPGTLKPITLKPITIASIQIAAVN
ncbi:MAG: hypothetical protein ABSE46_21095 [Terracidiphilus sp.]